MLEIAGKYLVLACTAGGLLFAPLQSAAAQSSNEQVAPVAPQLQDRGPSTPLVWFEPKLSARFRPELLVGGDLGPGHSPIEPGLGENGQGMSTIGWASTRLRMDTIIRAGSRLAIHLGMGVLEGRVLGAAPQMPALGGLSPSGWVNPSIQAVNWRDTLRVHQVYAHWRFLQWLDVSAGRMREHFGLGLYRNAGACEDCDHETLIDGVRVGASILGLKLDASYEFMGSGATSDLPAGPLSTNASSFAVDSGDAQGQDLGDKDDVRSFTFRLGQPEGKQIEGDAGNGTTLRWQILSSFVSQEFSSSEPSLSDLPSGCATLAETANGKVALPEDCWLLVPREASFWKPGVWMRLDRKLASNSRLRFEVEASAVFGEVINLQRRADLGNVSKKFSGIGGALEAAYESRTLKLGIDAGFATGDDGEFLGYLDGQNILVADDGLYEDGSNAAIRANTAVTSFWFHPGYRLDQILFRQVIGTVTNAVYAKPWVSQELLQYGDVTLIARLDAMYAAAIRPSGTPGGGRSYGVEVDGHLTLKLPRGLQVSTSAGVLMPLDALANRDSGANGDPALSVRGLLSWRY